MAKFEIGNLYMTAGISERVNKSHHFFKRVMDCLIRYSRCDWGNMCKEDKQLNDNAVESGDQRILARYDTSEGPVYIITEWDRSVTTILFAEEY